LTIVLDEEFQMKIDLYDILIVKMYIAKLDSIFASIDLLKLIGQNSLSESILTPYNS
jgi:hypothetical protein